MLGSQDSDDEDAGNTGGLRAEALTVNHPGMGIPRHSGMKSIRSKVKQPMLPTLDTAASRGDGKLITAQVFETLCVPNHSHRLV